MKKELVIVIPAYEPNMLMIDLLHKLNQYFSTCNILIVNDGSKREGVDKIFDLAKDIENVTILNHLVNKGKGAALKTAFKYIASLESKDRVIVTADADGQHKPEDIFKVASYYEEINEGLVLGSRQFDGKVPFRSRFGNDATKFIYRLCNNKKLYDNQTGLRAFGSDLLDFMIEVEGDRYEYEMNMLMECANRQVTISEVGIETVYINNNESSHFNPVRDFLKICKHMLKYAIPTLLTLVVDILAFTQVFLFYRYLEVETTFNLLISGFVGYFVSFIVHMVLTSQGVFYGNTNIFKNKTRKRRYILFGLAAVLLNTSLIIVSYYLVNNVAGAKAIAEGVFVVSYLLFNYFIVPKTMLH